MRLLREEEVREYCQGTPEGSVGSGLLEEALEADTQPALVVPLFELCRAVHFGARAGLAIGHFRECWQKLVAWHYEHASDGYLLMPMAIEEEGGVNLFQEIYDHSRIETGSTRLDLEVSQERVDPRDPLRDPAPFTACFRQIGELWARRLGAWNVETRRWENRWPDEMPWQEPREQIGGDLVLDTNVLIEVLEELPVSGRISQRLPWQSPRIARILAGAEKHFRRALLSQGEASKLIIPTSVLIETYGVIHSRRGEQYQRARDVLAAMVSQKDQWPLWKAFSLEAFSLEVFGAFLSLHELLVDDVKDKHQWPDFADAFVLAHALYNGCPVVSAEWVDKPECWEAVRAHYPFLYLRA